MKTQYPSHSESTGLFVPAPPCSHSIFLTSRWGFLPSRITPSAENDLRSTFRSIFRHRGLGRRQAGDRYPEGGARDVVQSHFVEKSDALRIAAVLTADAQLQGGVGL